MLGRYLIILLSFLLLFISIPLTSCGSSAPNPADIEAVLEKIYSASSEVDSYCCWHTETTNIRRVPPMVGIVETTIQGTLEGAYMSPNRAWKKRRIETKDNDLPLSVRIIESSHIGSNYYQRQDGETHWQVESDWPPPESPFKEDSLLLLDLYALVDAE